MKATLQRKNNTNSATSRDPSFAKGSDHFFAGTQKAFFATNAIQAKLTVNKPNDPFEVEADTMADRVVQRLSDSQLQKKDAPEVRSITPLVQMKCAECEKEEKLQEKESETLIPEKKQAQPLIDTKQEKVVQAKIETPVIVSDKSAVSIKAAHNSIVQTKCESCEQEEKMQKKEDENESPEKILKKPIFESENREPPDVDKKVLSQRKVIGLAHGDSIHLQSKCDACEQEEKPERKEIPQKDTQPLQLKTNAAGNESRSNRLAESGHIQPNVLKVVVSPTPTVQAKCTACEKEDQLQEKEEEGLESVGKLRMKPIFESENEEHLQDSQIHKKSELLQLQEAAPNTSPTANENENQPAQSAGGQAAQIVLNFIQTKSDSSHKNVLQRTCRECEEGNEVQRKSSADVQLQGDGSPAQGSREAIVAKAKAELGKVEARNNDGTGRRVGADRLLEYFHLAAPGIWSDSNIETAGAQLPSWCGIFSVYAHKKAGLDIGNWQIGRGVSAFGTLTTTDNPQPGDIGYIDQPYQHHNIIEKIEGDNVHTVDGNSGMFSEVKERDKSKSEYSGFLTAFGGSSTPVQRKDVEQSVQAKNTEGDNSASTSIEHELHASKGSGSSLPDSTKSGMEQSFGADFSGVRIHTDSKAVQMSKGLNAQAFTHGNDIYFNEGKYNPQTSSGKHLLAHELTHTIQQGSSIKSKPEIQKQDTTPTADADVPTIAQNVYDALDGWTSSADSANILSALRNRNKATIDLVITQVHILGSITNKEVFEWMISDMVTSDWRTLRDHFILVRVNGLEEIIANEIYDLLSGYTSDDDSHEILRLFVGTTAVMGTQLSSVLANLEVKAEKQANDMSEWLFDDLTLIDADSLSNHFFGSGSIDAIHYATHWRANKIIDLLAGWTGADDSTMIVRNFERTPDAMRTYVLYELDRMTMERWNEHASFTLMDNMWQSDYERLRGLVPSLPVWNIQRNWLEGLWNVISVGFDYLTAFIEYAVCGLAGVVWGILLIIRDIVVIVWDIIKAVYNLIGWVVNWASGNRLAREEAESVNGFFSSIGQFFGAPGAAISHMWNELVLESQLIEGPFRECQQAFYWMTRITNFIVNIVLIFVGGYGLAKLVAEGIEALINLVRAGELLAALGRLPGRMWAAIKGLPAAIARGVVSGIGRVVALIRNPITIVESVRNTVAIVRLAASEEGYFAFLRQQAGRALADEAAFWRERRAFWTRGADTTTTNLSNVEGKLVQAVDSAVDDPARAETLVNEATTDATATRSEADDLLNDVKGVGGEATQSFDNRLPELWREGSPQRPPLLNSCVTRLRGLNISDDTIVAIIRNVSLNADQSAADFFGDFNRFLIRAEGQLGRDGLNTVLTGLTSETDYRTARMLMQRVSNSQDISGIVRTFSLEEIRGLRVRFAAGTDAEFTNNLIRIVSRVNGNSTDILALLNEAGEGQQAMTNMLEALDRLGEGRFLPQQVRESLAFGRRLAEAIARGGDEVARTIWGDAFTGRDASGRIQVAAGLTREAAGDRAMAYINARLRGIAATVLGGEGGTQIDSVTWGVIRDAILNTDLPTLTRFQILGEVWAYSKVRLYENLGFTVIREVSIRVLDAAGNETATFAKVDAVLRRGAELFYKEFKSTAEAALRTNQEIVYGFLNDGSVGRLRPFGENAERAFGGPTLPEFRAGHVDVERPPL